ncbi:uncharacterized protein LOC141619489 [Silene latifolia]|uniref:uncharacterized protein LOC141619489 n=1 Tax=Silene latifolia TaxID=37657 RepID=UPI003D789CA2
MLKHDNGEPRVFTPRDLSFMDALTLSIQKARTESRKLLTPEGHTDHGLVCGDFNSITETNDRISGAEVSWAELALMRKMIDEYQLQEMKCSGSYYTWNNKHEDITKVYSRIDRVLINEQWFQSFPEAVANFLPEGLYDHCPCLINIVEELLEYGGQGTPMYRVVVKLKKLKSEFKKLNRGQFSDIENLTHVTELTLHPFQQQLSKDLLNATICRAEKECASDLSKLIKARNSYLAQKAKEGWIKDGDENTSFFHSSIKKRRMINRVYQVHDMEGQLCSKPEDILAAFEREMLHRPLSDEEIKSAMFSIPGDKAPGPDGFSSHIFKDSWHIVGMDVCHAMRNAFQSGKVLKELNTTILTLIPKTELPDSVLQFRPIACCNTVYKCLTKVLCTRMSSILPDIINPSQGAFVRNRDIVGNIRICQDLIKLYKRKVCSPRVMKKIDLQKAYDSIEWSFLQEMLSALNFLASSIGLIMQCVSPPTYSLALNGDVFGFFKGQRGLRGDLHSVRLLLRAFETFSMSSGLKMNNGKSNFYSNGVSEAIIKGIEEASGMRRGGIPFSSTGKYVWWVELKTDHLWVKWVHSVHLKNVTLRDYEPSINTSWAWRRICDVKNQLHSWLFDANWRAELPEYTVKLGYSWLVDEGSDVVWFRWVNNRIMLPKHKFFIWLVAQNRLLTQDRLMRMHIIQHNRCFVCKDAEEELNHLFLSCSFSRQCLRLLEDWLQMCLPIQEVTAWWLTVRARSLLLKQILAAVLAQLMYLIWHARNHCRMESVIPLSLFFL